jgi:tetratricopeptide (TPR) repeat protein
MSLPASSEGVAIAPAAAVNALRIVALCVAIGCLGACSSAPSRPVKAPPVVRSAAPTPAAAASSAGAVASAAGPAGTPGAAAVHPDVPPAARADFDRALNFMRAKNMTEAELGFKQVALQYPQFAAPLVNVAIIKRKQGDLPEAEQFLKTAVARESGNAVAWTELGATQSLRGEFKDAANSYHAAIAADPRYAPAWRNLGVVEDLYLGDPHRALTSLEQYKLLSGEDKPVSGWIAELRQRLGIAAVKPPAAPAPAPDTTAPGAPATPGGTPAPGAPAPTPTPAKGGN